MCRDGSDDLDILRISLGFKQTNMVSTYFHRTSSLEQYFRILSKREGDRIILAHLSRFSSTFIIRSTIILELANVRSISVAITRNSGYPEKEKEKRKMTARKLVLFAVQCSSNFG